nr:hypothetical protein [Tanacetum cinerariifolium]
MQPQHLASSPRRMCESNPIISHPLISKHPYTTGPPTFCVPSLRTLILVGCTDVVVLVNNAVAVAMKVVVAAAMTGVVDAIGNVKEFGQQTENFKIHESRIAWDCHSVHGGGRGADNRPPMPEKDMYDSWKSRMKLYMLNRPHSRMILESVEQGPLIWPSMDSRIS